MPLYRRKPITAIRDGGNYKITDGLGNISVMPKKQFEALFEQVGNDGDIISDDVDVNGDDDKNERKKTRR